MVGSIIFVSYIVKCCFSPAHWLKMSSKFQIICTNSNTSEPNQGSQGIKKETVIDRCAKFICLMQKWGFDRKQVESFFHLQNRPSERGGSRWAVTTLIHRPSQSLSISHMSSLSIRQFNFSFDLPSTCGSLSATADVPTRTATEKEARQSSARGAYYVVREWENMWLERVWCHGKTRWGSQTDGKHTRVGLISPSGWSGRSSPSGSTQCPSWRGSDVVVWEELCRSGEEVLEGLLAIDRSGSRTATPESCVVGHIDLIKRWVGKETL